MLIIAAVFFVASVAVYLFILNSAKSLETIGADGEPIGIDLLLKNRREARLRSSSSTDPFGEDGKLSVLLIGLDSRVGDSAGHCDAIQFFEIDKEEKLVSITAVPRGTYSPLPFGRGTTSSDYYVSNSCGLGGLEYGIEQIERIVGQEADHVVVVGFSGVMGILRTLQLPTTETLQWLRHRQGYAIGEPQRARNHSTFLKKMLLTYTPNDVSSIDTPLHYLIYNIVQTDLSFAESQEIVKVLTTFDLAEHPDRVTLAMRPAHDVKDIPYEPDEVAAYVESMITPIKHLLSRDDYQNIDKEDIDNNLEAFVESKKEDPLFLEWAYINKLWLQIDDEDTREGMQYEMTALYVASLDDIPRQRSILEDYILEMEYQEEERWEEKGRALLKQLFAT